MDRDTTAPWEGAPSPPRRWQAEALPRVIAALESGTRGVVSAFMGGGKSILAAEVVHQRMQLLTEDEVVVVGAPRRKLVRQLARAVSRRCGGLLVGAFYTGAKDIEQPVVVTCYASARALAATLERQGRRVALLVADECHQTEADTVIEAFEVLQPAAAVGFTATPFRSQDTERLSLWDEIIYRYTYNDAIADRVVTSYRVINWDGEGRADVDQICLEHIRAHGEGPGIVSALSIEDAESYASLLSEQGIAAAAIHSRQGEPEQTRLISELQAGGLSALVHVSLLAEGVDLPWLRWLCLRRPVQSKVRFVQELGRVLRAHPGKEIALIIDPHDLLGKHGLSHPERLSDALLEEGEARPGRGVPREAPVGLPQMPPAVAVGDVAAYLRWVQGALERVGLPPPERFDSAHWHHDRPSRRQLSLLRRYTWAPGYLPKGHRELVEQLMEPTTAASLSKLDVSELICVLLMIRGAWSRWRADGGRGSFTLPELDLGAPPSLQLPAHPGISPITDEHPPASRAWLHRLPEPRRAAASALFQQAIRARGAQTPREVCRAVFVQLKERLDIEEDPHLVQIRNLLLVHLQQAFAFAVAYLEWEALSTDERRRRLLGR